MFHKYYNDLALSLSRTFSTSLSLSFSLSLSITLFSLSLSLSIYLPFSLTLFICLLVPLSLCLNSLMFRNETSFTYYNLRFYLGIADFAFPGNRITVPQTTQRLYLESRDHVCSYEFLATEICNEILRNINI
jgi:hypothetical protein